MSSGGCKSFLKSANLASMAIMAIFLVLLLGQLISHLSHKTGIPSAPLILILGLIIGLSHEHTGQFGEGVHSWNTINPRTFLFIFMPPLIFESAFHADWHTFKREIWQVLILSGPALLICIFLTGLFFYYVLDYQSEISLTAAFMFSSIISATDPVAVVAMLKQLGASKRFATLVEGESHLSDGVTLVMFEITVELVLGQHFNFGHAVVSFIRLSFGGIVLGIVVGFVVNFFIRRIINNLVLEFNLTLVAAYLVFYIAEDTPLHVSGLIALVCMGLYMTMKGRMGISIESEAGVHHIWQYFGFLAETVIFTAAGVFIGTKLLSSNIIWQDYLKLLALWAGLQVIRFLAVLSMFAFLRKLGYGLSFKQLLVLAYGGLKGAVGLLLALVVDLEHDIDQRTRDLVVFHVGGIALLTLLINGTTIRFLISKLGLSRVSKVQQRIMALVLQMLERKGFKEAKSLQNEKHFNLFDWQMVRSRITVDKFYRPLIKKKFLEGNTNKRAYVSNNSLVHEEEDEGSIFIDKKDYTKDELMVEARVRFLKMLKGKYWNKFEHGLCTSDVVLRLLESADRALDHQSTEIQDWEHLQNIVKSHSQHKCKKCTSCLFKSKCCGSVLKHFFIHKVSISYGICVNFIEAHQYVRRVQEEVVYDQDIKKRVEEESLQQTQKAQKFLHQNFDGFYPSLAKVVQNKRAIYYALRQMNAFIHELKLLGKINTREAKALLALNLHRIHSEMFHSAETDLPEDRKLALCSDLKHLVEEERLNRLVYSESSLIHIDAGEEIYKQGQCAPRNIYFVTRGGILEKRNESAESSISHKIGQIFGLGNIIISNSVATTTAKTFTEVLQIPICAFKDAMRQEKQPQLWRRITLQLILTAPDCFGPLRKFERGEIHEILRRSTLTFFNEGENIDLSSGGLFIEGEAIGKRIDHLRLCSPRVRDDSESKISEIVQDLQTQRMKESVATQIAKLSRMEEHLNELERRSKQNEKEERNNHYLKPRQYEHQNTCIFYKALKFIYPMEGILAQATSKCTLFLLPEDLKDTWLSHAKVVETMGLKSGLGTGTISRQNPHNIHRVGLPVQLVPAHQRIKDIEQHHYEQDKQRPLSRRNSMVGYKIEIPEKEHSILTRVKSEDPHQIMSEIGVD